MISCGIYKITNQLNNKCYIGQSINIEERWRHHKHYPQNMSHYPLYRAFEKYGLENFNFEILLLCSPQELDEKEIEYIKQYNSYQNGYNQTMGGSKSGHIVKISNEDLMIIIDLLQNSNITQRNIAQMFHIGEDTVSEINQGKTRQQENYIYPLRNNKKHYYCIDCGIELKYNTMRCRKCKGINERVVKNRPSRDELKQLIRTLPFTTIGKQYNVSDNTIRKWCKAYNLPFKKTEIKKYTDIEWVSL